MRLAYQHRKAARLLLIERLKETAPRAGFFEEDRYRAMVRHPGSAGAAVALAEQLGRADEVLHEFGKGSGALQRSALCGDEVHWP